MSGGAGVFIGNSSFSVGSLSVSAASGINMAGLKIQNLATCTQPADTANKLYVDSRAVMITNIGTGAPVAITRIGKTTQLRTLIGNGYTITNDSTQIYFNYDLHNFSVPQYMFDNTTVLTDLSGAKWMGSVLAQNGKIYGIPYDNTEVLVYDTYFNTLDTIPGDIPANGSSWAGGILAPNGNIYCIPYNNTSILIINPITGTTTNITASGIVGNGSWFGGVLGVDGNIYGIPYNSTRILKIITSTNVIDTSTLSGALTSSAKYVGGVLAPNGNIYCCPYNTTNVLIINTRTNILNTSSISGLPSTTNKWAGGTYSGTSDKIYFAPNAHTRVLVVTPIGNIVDSSSIVQNINGNKWFGATLGSDGQIYCASDRNTRMLVINPVNGTSSTTLINTFSIVAGSQNYAGGIMSPNGNLYYIPNNATNIGVLGTGILNVPILQSLSAYYNKL